MKIRQNSEEPIYRQIARQFEEDILSGKLKEGEYLPSIRSLAKDLRISVITTMKAYEELAQSGLATAVQGKGYYVNSQNTEMLMEQHMIKLEEHLMNALNTAKLAGISLSEVIEIMKTLSESTE